MRLFRFWFCEAKRQYHQFLENLKCDENTFYVFNKGYNNYKAFKHFKEHKTGFVTSIKDDASYIIIEELNIGE